ncbi:MAG TPA: DUF3299 domain-containing protein [Rhizobiales bacterium]|nr:DUF3299 domain-containing protein [Hyphomicrobiales bacterium]
MAAMRCPGFPRLLVLLSVSLAAPASPPAMAASAEARSITWPALRGPLTGGNIGDPAGLAWTLDGETVEIKGYALPVDRDGDLVYEFMLVPRPGACSHMAQPPPEQVIHVTARTPFRMAGSYEFVSISGRIRPGLEKTQLFIMDGVAVIESGYSIGRADVARADEGLGAMPARRSSPWGFLR